MVHLNELLRIFKANFLHFGINPGFTFRLALEGGIGNVKLDVSSSLAAFRKGPRSIPLQPLLSLCPPLDHPKYSRLPLLKPSEHAA